MSNHSMDHMHGGGMGHDQPSSKDEPSTFGGHNQMMVGEQTIYLSHLPMFDRRTPEHQFQVILEVTLSRPSNAQATYSNDRRSHPNVRMYTMEPVPFEMVELDPQHPTRTELTGTIWRGHLERPGRRAIINDATAKVENTIYYHHLDPDTEPLDQLEYLLFGKAPDLFLAHVITRPPDFDQILGVTISGFGPAAEDLARGIRIQIPGRANTAHTRIKAGERVMAQAQLPGAEEGEPVALQLETSTEFYFEEGELRLEMDMEQTPEEAAAGF